MDKAGASPSWFRQNKPLALMLLVLGVYLLTMSGHTYSPDEETMLVASRSLVERGTWAIAPSGPLVQVSGADGRQYSQYGPGQSLAAVPWVSAGLLVGNFFPRDQAGFPLRLILGSYNALIAAGVCGLLAATGRALGYGGRASLYAGGALAFATYLWPHSRTFFSEPLTALLLLASFYLALIAMRARVDDPARSTAIPIVGPSARARYVVPLLLALSGALFALAVATKVQYVVALPAYLVYVGWLGLQGAAPPTTLIASDGQGSAWTTRKYLAPNAAWLTGLALGLLPLLLYNWAIFGSPFTTGYGSDLRATFKTPLYEGAYGLLLSSGKGLAWYAPPVLISLWGFSGFARKHRPEATFVLLVTLPVIALFSLYAFWHGDGSWGPRYLVPILPFALLPALAVIEHAIGRRTKQNTHSSLVTRHSSRFTPLPLGIASVVGLGFLVNVLAVLVNFDTQINVANDNLRRYWEPGSSPIVGHINLLGQRVTEWRHRLSPQSGTVHFTEGFSYSEGDKISGALLPRWTVGAGELQLWPHEGSGPVSVTLHLTDHRPPEIGKANVSILVNGAPTPANAIPLKDPPISADYTFTAEGRPARITIKSDTWNPSEVGAGERNEDIGVKLDAISVSEGEQPSTYELVEAQPAPPYYPQPRWYYDPATHHPADLWPLYMAEAGMGRKTIAALGLPIVSLALLCLALGWRGLTTA